MSGANVGGFHLTSANFDAIVPGHCPGWRVTSLLATNRADTYVLSSIGMRLHFGADQATPGA